MKYNINIEIMKKKKQFNVIMIVFLTLFSNLSLLANDNYWQIDSVNNPAAGYLMIDNPRPYMYMYSYILADNYNTAPYFESLHSDIAEEYSYYFPFSNGTIGCLKGYTTFVYNQNMDIIDTIPYPPQYTKDFHAAIYLENGHYILLCADRVVMDLSNIVDGGLPDAEIITTKLVETDNTGEIYWEWNPLDHFSITDVTDDVDLTQQVIDFTHPNAIAETSDGNIYLSNRNLDEVTKINKETGEIIWRMGGSYCENNEFTFINDDIGDDFGFSHQHSIAILENGNLLLFDNGNMRPDFYSRAVEYEIDEAHKTAIKVWEYRHIPDTQTASMGNCQRLPNGNTLINWAFGDITEVRPDGSIALSVSLQEIPIYRAFKTFAKLDVVMKFIDRNGEFVFDNDDKNTGIKLSVDDFDNNGNLSIEKHNYTPPTYTFSDSIVSNILPYRWVARKDSLGSMNGMVHININDVPSGIDPLKISIYNRTEETRGNFEQLETYYNSDENTLVAPFQNLGEFIICSYILETPELSFPNNESHNNSTNIDFVWSKVNGSQEYIFQVSDSDSFENILHEVSTNINSCVISDLEKSHQYFWRVYAMNSKDSSDWSEVFTFSTKLSEPMLLHPFNNSKDISLTDSLKWSMVEKATGYDIQCSESKDFQNKDIYAYTTNTFYQLSELNYSRSYYWRVRANSNTDTSDWSTIYSFETINIAPKLQSPYNLELDVPLSGFLNWLSIPSVVSYSFEIAKDSKFRSIVLSDSSLTDNYYLYSGLEYSTKYYWRVKAIFLADTSDWSPIWAFTTVNEYIVRSPDLLSPVNESTDNEVNGKLIWSRNEDDSYYELNVSKTLYFESLIVEEYYLQEPNFAYTEFEPDSTYYWRVKAFSSVDSSNWSSVWSFKIKDDKELGFVYLIYPFYNSIQIPIESEFCWKSKEDAEKYQLQITDYSFNPDSLLIDFITSDTIFIYSGLKNNEKYLWRVRYFTESDTSEWSYPCLFTTVPIILLDTPELVYPIDIARIVPVDVEFKWKKIDGVGVYKLECSQYPHFLFRKYYFRDIETDIFKLYTLNYNTKYYWHIMAYNDSSYSEWTNSEVFYTELQPPIIVYPDSTVIEMKVNDSIVWDTVDGADRYIIEFSKGELFDSVLTSDVIHKKLSYNYSLDEDTKYFYRVRALNDSNESQWNIGILKTERVSGLDNFSLTYKDVRIYPNPAKNELIAEISNINSDKVNLKIVNIFGDKVFQESFTTSESDVLLLRLDVSFLISGIYYVISEYDSEVFVKKLIVVN